MSYDLHTHSTYSDGTTSVEANVRDALAIGLAGLGVTDHDTTAPFDDAMAAADGTDLEIVPGTEFSAELDGFSVHVLGYWIDPRHAELVEELARLRNEREDRARAIVDKFVALGIELDFERVRALAGDAPIGRPHIAQAVVETGAAPDLRMVFDTWLADGGPAYVEKHAVSPVRAVELLTAAGGVAVLAHPGLYGAAVEPGRAGGDRSLGPGLDDEVVEAMAAAGLAGIEADHPDHTDEHRRRYRDLAVALGLEVTAGSDYHGAGKENPLGSATTDRATVERLRTRR
ncbi:MAG TPA: PHP domain-containing protein [Egicoccus sp.]|nr:PHP domain-containing protein [Egicoccus sp.]HSK23449.1 PHP domain-containing protein [Egicoccus sp.]